MVAFISRASFIHTMIAGTIPFNLSSGGKQPISVGNGLIPSENDIITNNNNDNQSSLLNESSHYLPVSTFVREHIKDIIKNQDPTLAGSILRLAFHDATVRSHALDPSIGGADGSIRYELDWPENRGLRKPLEVVTEVYQKQKETFCPGTTSSCNSLSFADTLALAGTAAVEAASGPCIKIRLGRRDVVKADNRYLDHPIDRINNNSNGSSSTAVQLGERSILTTSLPSPGLDSVGIVIYFKRLGLTEQELIALSGAHDLGRHVTLTGMSKDCLKQLTRNCLENAPVLTPFVTQDPDTLSNQYFQTLLRWNDRVLEYGEALFIPTDVALVVDDKLKEHVVAFARSEILFFREFTIAYQKLVDSTATSKLRF